MTVISQKFLHAISDYIHVAKSATFLRVNVINKLVELINVCAILQKASFRSNLSCYTKDPKQRYC